MHITFVELAGRDAHETLAALEASLAANAAARTELLRSTDEPQLSLLVVRTEGPADLRVPDGARIWRFEATP